MLSGYFYLYLFTGGESHRTLRIHGEMVDAADSKSVCLDSMGSSPIGPIKLILICLFLFDFVIFYLYF